MPTLATTGFDLKLQDPRNTSRCNSASFFLDAEELCMGMGGLHHPPSALLKPDTSRDLLTLPCNNQMTTAHSNAAMQFLLLDEDEAPGVGSAPTSPDTAANDGSLHDTSAYLNLSPEDEHPCGTAHGQSRAGSVEAAAKSPDPSSCLLAPLPSTLYCLAVVDEFTGLPLRPATPEEAWEVERCFVLQEQESDLLLQQGGGQHQLHGDMDCTFRQHHEAPSPFLAAEPAAVAMHLQQQQQQQQHETRQEEEEEEEEEVEVRPAPAPRRPEQRRCGPCDNCGATESPQWRQGPASKPLLCNACGMRFRRTNQLLPGDPSALSGARGRGIKRSASGGSASPTSAAAAAAASARLRQKQQKEQKQQVQQQQLLQPQSMETKRPKRAAAVAAAATVAAAIDAFS